MRTATTRPCKARAQIGNGAAQLPLCDGVSRLGQATIRGGTEPYP
ncbi:hypothetical protein [Rhodobacter ferrooxidans]|nr:hypothetical protein [Rhodobacter sp. SW2]